MTPEERAIRDWLPEPETLPHVIAACRPNGTYRAPLCSMAGYSDENGDDWSIYHEGLIGDAHTDAQTVAAILNAYRMGIIGVKEPQP